MVLKQCGQDAMTFLAPASLSVSMFCWASMLYTNSLPRRRAGSPVQVSAGPSTANETPAVCSSSAMALVVFLGEGGLDQHLVAAHPVDVVDVLDVDRAFLDAGAAVRAGPDHVRVDDAVLLLGPDQRPFGLGLDGVRQLLPRLVGTGEDVRGLGEGVVAQVEDDLLGGQRLAGDPGRALRLAAAALGAGAQV